MEQKTDKRGRIIHEEIPFTGIREVIGKRMEESLRLAPQGSISARFDMSEVVAFRAELKKNDIHVSFTDIFIKAVSQVAQQVPIMNSTLENKMITVYETVNVGIAVQVEDILMVPVINNVETKTLFEISEETRGIIDDTRNRRFEKLYLDGATITVNNLGIFYIDSCTPIVNYPETAILGIGKISKEPWVSEAGEIVVRDVSSLSLTINHAVVDGGQAGKFMGLLKDVLLDPKKHIKIQ